jgi:hypothetical protein
MGMVSNDVLDDLRMVGCGEGDDARQEDMRAASAAYDEIVRLRTALKLAQSLDDPVLIENARLRETMEKIVGDDAYGCKRCRDIARAALGEEKK